MNALKQLSCEKVQKGVNKTAATEKNWHHYAYILSVANPHFELRRGPGSILLAQSVFLPSVISFFFFFTQNKGEGGGGGPPGPPP